VIPYLSRASDSAFPHSTTLKGVGSFKAVVWEPTLPAYVVTCDGIAALDAENKNAGRIAGVIRWKTESRAE